LSSSYYQKPTRAIEGVPGEDEDVIAPGPSAACTLYIYPVSEISHVRSSTVSSLQCFNFFVLVPNSLTLAPLISLHPSALMVYPVILPFAYPGYTYIYIVLRATSRTLIVPGSWVQWEQITAQCPNFFGGSSSDPLPDSHLQEDSTSEHRYNDLSVPYVQHHIQWNDSIFGYALLQIFFGCDPSASHSLGRL
jgi:hypothetical protein